MSTSNSAIHHPLSCTGVPGSDVRRLTISDMLGKSKKCLNSKFLGIPEAVHDRLMFAIRSLAGDLKVLSSMSETMAKIISSIGFVFLFDRVRVKGVIMTKIVASNGVVGDEFGYSASMDGDYAIIGAPDKSVGAVDDDFGGSTYHGSAYIFMRSTNAWTQQANLTASDGSVGDEFGTSVSLAGDYALIGAIYDSVGGNYDQGSAYIFLRSGVAWNEQAKLNASNGAAGDEFGTSVSLSGDYALIGAPYVDDMFYTDKGSAYVFMRSGTAWTQQSNLTASNAQDDDQFGWSVSLSGDYALIGSPYDDYGSSSDEGSVYVFLRSETNWDQQDQLYASNGGPSNYFGYSVAIDDSYIIVGAYGKDVSGNTNQGSAYIFMLSGSVWSEQAILRSSDGENGDEFGYSVSLSGDYALVGAPDVDGTQANQGSAYVFMRSGSDWGQTELNTSDKAADDEFGWATALDGENALVGARGVDSEQGAAYTYSLANLTFSDDDAADDDDMDDDDGSMMVGGVSILGLSLISFLIIM